MSPFERFYCLIFSTSVVLQLITLGFRFYKFQQDPPSNPVVVLEKHCQS